MEPQDYRHTSLTLSATYRAVQDDPVQYPLPCYTEQHLPRHTARTLPAVVQHTTSTGNAGCCRLFGAPLEDQSRQLPACLRLAKLHDRQIQAQKVAPQPASQLTFPASPCEGPAAAAPAADFCGLLAALAAAAGSAGDSLSNNSSIKSAGSCSRASTGRQWK